MKPLCRTRWVERHDALEVFLELFPAIVQALSDIAHKQDSVSWNNSTISDAYGLLAAIEKFSFLVTLVVVQNVMSYIKALTKLLQGRSLDIVHGIELVEDLQKQLEEIRDDVEEWHKVWFTMASHVAEEEGTEEPSIPRRCGRQTQRDNVDGETAEVYYRRALTIPFLDHLISQLKERFNSHAKTASLGLCLVPSVMATRSSDADIHRLEELYEGDLPSPLNITAEVHQWKRKFREWSKCDLPTSPLGALNNCDERVFPNIATLLKILCTIPVTSCEAERSFSALRRLKTFLRSTISEDRLTGLALLHIHRDIRVDLDDAVDRFAHSHSRRLQLL